MKKFIIAVLVALFTITLAPTAQASDCGHFETRYRIEQVYIPPTIIGYTVQGYPIYSEGYFVSQYVPYTVWVSVPCYRPMPRYYAPRYRGHSPRVRIGIGLHF